MANRNYPSARRWSNHLFSVELDATISVGAAGAPTIDPGAGNAKGITSITRLATGTYRVQLQDNFAALNRFSCDFQSAPTGSAVAGGAFVSGTVYTIVSMGTTTQAQWVAAGVPSGITAAPGVTFKAASAGAGSGTVKALAASGIGSTELLGSTANMLNNQPYQQGFGGYVDFRCYDTTGTAADPANGSKMFLSFSTNNSQIQ
jgi:hypothetical protein